MRIHLKVAVIAALLALFTAAVAHAQGKHRFFDRMDANTDGFLSTAEIQKQFPKFTAEMFKKADTNGDGKLSVEEWQTFAKAKRAEMKGA